MVADIKSTLKEIEPEQSEQELSPENIKKKLKMLKKKVKEEKENGVVDSLKFCLDNYKENKHLINNLILAF